MRAAVAESEEAKAAFHAQQQQSTSGAACRHEVLSIMRQTRKGGCLAGIGVHGRLGDLGTIPAEYDVAVSTACGVLDFIVVDTGDAANACISYLRENNKGRASFIALDQINQTISQAKMNANLTVPAGTSRLFDHVVPKHDMFRVAFYMGLKDTLVTSDWDLAARVAYEGNRVKWRVVTTTGNLIDVSGSMTGGGKASAGGKMLSSSSAQQKASTSSSQKDASSSQITQKRIDELEGAVGIIQGKLSKCRSDITTNSQMIKSNAKDLKNVMSELGKIDMSISRVQSQRETIFSRVTVLLAEQTLTPEEEQELQEMGQRLQSVVQQIDPASHFGCGRPQAEARSEQGGRNYQQFGRCTEVPDSQRGGSDHQQEVRQEGFHCQGQGGQGLDRSQGQVCSVRSGAEADGNRSGRIFAGPRTSQASRGEQRSRVTSYFH